MALWSNRPAGPCRPSMATNSPPSTVDKCDVRPALRRGDLALTSTRFSGGATAEIARRQSDGTWLWVADQPNVTG